MVFTSNIIEVLNRIIKIDKKITQVDLAKKMNVTPGAVSKWLKIGAIETDKIQQLCIALNITPNILFGLNEDISFEKAIMLYEAYLTHPKYQDSINKLLNLK